MAARAAPSSRRCSRAVVIADDSVLLREGLARLLTEAGSEIVRHLMRAHSARNPLLRLTDREHELLAKARPDVPDVQTFGPGVFTVR